MWATSVIFKKMHKVNNNPLGNYLGENSPNLVTLPVSSPIFLSASLPFLFFLHYSVSFSSAVSVELKPFQEEK
jgi:hypothetical protein